MKKRHKSLKDDTRSISSLKSDAWQLAQSLREARLNRSLSQEQLANKLGLRQRQISDLERAAHDPRLSTIQNVSRVLDLELMLVPRHLITAVEGLQRSSTESDASSKRPMYTLGDDEDFERDDDARPEVGTDADTENATHPERR